MNNNAIDELLSKWKQGTLSEKEKKVLMSWYIRQAKQQLNYEIDTAQFSKDLQELKNYNFKSRKTKIRSLRPYYSAAALILVFISFIFIAVYYNSSTKMSSSDPIFSQGNRAILHQINGESVALEDFKSGDKVINDHFTTTKIDSGTIVYSLNGNHKQIPDYYEEITTPKGGEFKVILTDGTKVWLNNKTKLKFFISSTTAERHVWLQGEAFFEVAHDKDRPFFVTTGKQKVKVLGTAFNINTNDNQIVTTLVSGKVAINSNKIILKPGEQSITHDYTNYKVSQVDIEAYVSWKNGYFLFNYEPLSEVLSKLGDWYDVDFEVEQDLGDEKVWATVSRKRNLQDALKLIEKSGIAKFTINKERRISVQRVK
ncbi:MULTISPECIES: FecR family protein [Sphingobacterium]|jgi:transmembrane sensor|uniref:FecR family protein n=1 Tax=Sphingobacterium litopenaei TaxID=2763500 RepID=A0ABR7YDD4_9SPHI|nr:MULTISPECIES: FecR family protein [Sphingobacterium]MBD1429223.1 FecR family protein [Sphingobacterium litopenaei]